MDIAICVKKQDILFLQKQQTENIRPRPRHNIRHLCIIRRDVITSHKQASSLYPARMVKLVDTTDLKSVEGKPSCRFDSGSGHQHNQFIVTFLTDRHLFTGYLVVDCNRP